MRGGWRLTLSSCTHATASGGATIMLRSPENSAVSFGQLSPMSIRTNPIAGQLMHLDFGMSAVLMPGPGSIRSEITSPTGGILVTKQFIWPEILARRKYFFLAMILAVTLVTISLGNIRRRYAPATTIRDGCWQSKRSRGGYGRKASRSSIAPADQRSNVFRE